MKCAIEEEERVTYRNILPVIVEEIPINPAPSGDGLDKNHNRESCSPRPASEDAITVEDVKRRICKLCLQHIPGEDCGGSSATEREGTQEQMMAEKEDWLLEKLKLITVLQGVYHPLSCHLEKWETIMDLVKYFRLDRSAHSKPVYQAVFHMLAVNMFRVPSLDRHFCTEATNNKMDDQAKTGWTYGKSFFNIVESFVLNREFRAQIAEEFVTEDYIMSLLDLFNSKDIRFRNIVKLILHGLYSKMPKHRAFMFAKLSTLLQNIHGDEYISCTAQVLQIVASLVRGFRSPLQPQRLTFLADVLMPCHRSHLLPHFSDILSFTVCQFLRVDPVRTTDVVVCGLVDSWPPRSCSLTEPLLLQEVEDIADLLHPEEFKKVSCPLFRRIARSISRRDNMVTEKALNIWANESVMKLFMANHKEILPIVFPAIYNIEQSRLNAALINLGGQVFRKFLLIDSKLVQELRKDVKTGPESEAVLGDVVLNAHFNIEPPTG